MLTENLGYSQENFKFRGEEYIKNNLRSYELHVLKNHVVSLPYSYWFDNSNVNIFVDKERKNLLKIDDRERNGLYKYGIHDSLNLAVKNPNKIISLYSPPGPVSFDSNPSKRYEKPYDIGQLYLMWFDGNKINNIAVSLNKGSYEWLKETFPKDYFDFADVQIEKDKIGFFITTPHLINLNIEEFINYPWQFKDVVFQSNNLDGLKKFYIGDVMSELKKSLNGNLRTELNFDLYIEKYKKGHSTDKIYQGMIKQMMDLRGLMVMKLGGGCGGKIVEINDLLPHTDVSVLFNQTLFKTPNLSTEYRLENQRDENNNDNTYPCPHCTKPIPYEKNPKDKASWRKICPNCGGSLTGQCQ